MATRCAFENSNEVGVFSALTNSYCLAGMFMDTVGVLQVVPPHELIRYYFPSLNFLFCFRNWGL